MKKLVFVLLLMGCATSYVIPDGKTQYDFEQAKTECNAISGEKVGGFALGHPIFVVAVLTVGAGYNAVVESKFRDCMKERGFEAQK